MVLSVQLWTVRDLLNSDPGGTLKALAEAGLTHVELAGTAGLTPEQFKAKMDEAGIKASGMHVGLDQLINKFDATVAEAKLFGLRDVIVPWVPDPKSEAGFVELAAKMRPLGEQLRDNGLQLGYHNHAFEMAVYGDRTGYSILFDALPMGLVRPQIDLWWVMVGGQDPHAFLAKFATFAPNIHAKDSTANDTKTQVALGAGRINWALMSEGFREAKCPTISIELDESGDPMRDVRESVKHLKPLLAKPRDGG